MDWGEPSGLGTVSVLVTVCQDGGPISNAMVALFPRSGSSAMRPAAGTTGADGRCDLHTRWDVTGTKLSSDSTHEGFRGIYLTDVSDLVGR